MPELAEDSFFSVRHSPQEERARREKRREVEALTNVGSFQSHTARAIQEEREAHRGPSRYVLHGFGKAGVSILTTPLGSTPTLAIADVRIPPLQGEKVVALLLREDVFGSGQFTVIHAEPLKARKQKTAAEITDEAKRRLAGREELTEKLLSIVEEGASAINISLKRIAVRPGWSHEYEDTASVVINVEIEGTDDQRFSLWDSISAKLDRLSETLGKEEQVSLINDVSVIVTQG